MGGRKVRLNRPSNWMFMSDEEKQRWAEKAGKDIEDAKKKIEEVLKDMKENPKKYENKHLVIPPKVHDGMRWYPGGKF